MMSTRSFVRMIMLVVECSLLVVYSSAFLLNDAGVHRPSIIRRHTTSASSYQSLSHRRRQSPAFASSTIQRINHTNIYSNSNNSNNNSVSTSIDSLAQILTNLRTKLRQLTGFSVSAIRASLRVSTGFSLTAARLALRGFTGGVVTKTMKHFTAIFPSQVRYFMQPFLILYFTPVMILKSLADRPKDYTQRLASHEKLLNGWKSAVRRAERVQNTNGNYWPVHVNGTYYHYRVYMYYMLYKMGHPLS